jgi:hypothetical protein
MRYIQLTTPPPNPEWLAKADQLLAKLMAAPNSDARKEIIDANSKVWGEMKEWLLSLSHQKCWFSEAKDCFSHWDVEHFRPKKSAKDKDGNEYEGYWWLSFDWSNFRICGNAGNRKKGTYFPLREESQRVNLPEVDLRMEDPLLLDPADADDPVLLSFDVEGRAIPAPGLDNEWDKMRVEYSIQRFNLDFSPLEAKRKIVWNDCWNHIQQYRKELEICESGSGINTNIARIQLKEKAKAIRVMMQPDKELSAVARACVLSSGDRRITGLLQSA